MTSVLASTLDGAKAATTLFTYVTSAPAVTISGTNPAEPATATTVGATASAVTPTRITIKPTSGTTAAPRR
jgi:hypothetical protein